MILIYLAFLIPHNTQQMLRKTYNAYMGKLQNNISIGYIRTTIASSSIDHKKI